MKKTIFLFPLLILLSGCPFPEDVGDYPVFSNNNFRVANLWAPLDRRFTDHADFRPNLRGIKKQLCSNPYNVETCEDGCTIHWKANEVDGEMVMDCVRLPRDIQKRFALRLSHPDRRQVFISPYLSVQELMENSCRETFFGSFYRPFSVTWVAEEPAHLEIRGSVRNCRADFASFGGFSIGLKKTNLRFLAEGSYVCDRSEVALNVWSFSCSISPQSGIGTLYLDLTLNYRDAANVNHPLPEIVSTSLSLANILAPEVLAQFDLPVPGNNPAGGGNGVEDDGGDEAGDGDGNDGEPPVPLPEFVPEPLPNPAPIVDPAPIADKDLNNGDKAAADSAGDKSSGGGCAISPRGGQGVFLGWLIPVGLYFLARRSRQFLTIPLKKKNNSPML